MNVVYTLHNGAHTKQVDFNSWGESVFQLFKNLIQKKMYKYGHSVAGR